MEDRTQKQDRLDYGRMMRHAFQRLMADALKQVAAYGLPGEHHFYITFATNFPGVEMPKWLRKQHGSELTIVLQHEFSELTIAEDRFAVSLSFSHRTARVSIPFDAVKTFADPAAEFGLRFDLEDASAEANAVKFEPEAQAGKAPVPEGQTNAENANEQDSAEILRLDSFRKPS